MSKNKIAIQGELGAYSHIAAENLYKDPEIKSNLLEREAPELFLEEIAGYNFPSNNDFYLKEYKLVNFWASWCPPCQYAFPHTVALFTENRERGLQVVSVSLDSAADAPKAQQFLDSVGASFVNLLCTEENAIASFDIPDAIPYYTLYDRQGRLRYRFSPMFTDGVRGETPASIDRRVQELLAE